MVKKKTLKQKKDEIGDMLSELEHDDPTLTIRFNKSVYSKNGFNNGNKRKKVFVGTVDDDFDLPGDDKSIAKYYYYVKGTPVKNKNYYDKKGNFIRGDRWDQDPYERITVDKIVARYNTKTKRKEILHKGKWVKL